MRMALEAWHDGCLGEGAAATRARRSLAGAKDAGVRAALGEIARAEADAAWDETWAAARRDGERMLKRTLAVVG
ncbi:hypothetical protein [Sorangium sp. So ce363]|uniref:hypothetical protein n=1 Tax=Sorangium sp. So ce363 TaxID=3133304 RepID=UPI003F62DC35